MHGDESKAAEYRAAVVDYIRANKDEYIQFIGLFDGGATRRNPKRKAAPRARLHHPTASNRQLNAAFEERLADMAKGGTWGDNQEVVAFSRLYQVEIIIWSTGVDGWLRIEAPENSDLDKRTLYIVFHVSLTCNQSI